MRIRLEAQVARPHAARAVNDGRRNRSERRQPSAGHGTGHLYLAPTRHGWSAAVWSRFPIAQITCLPLAAECDWKSYRAVLDAYIASATVHLPDGTTLSATSLDAIADPIPSISVLHTSQRILIIAILGYDLDVQFSTACQRRRRRTESSESAADRGECRTNACRST
jgi:hypothetical protein